MVIFAIAHGLYFNSRPSARGDPRRGNVTRRAVISIHAPPRGATKKIGSPCLWLVFQFTPLREGRRISSNRSEWEREFQFTPLREGRPSETGIGKKRCISIHAPPRGATKLAALVLAHHQISIHAPPRGATFPSGKLVYSRIFQFTPLREGRLEAVVQSEIHDISIHAPPRGATSSTTRAHGGWRFQFTPLREGRPGSAAPSSSSSNFNSRPSARGDAGKA